jgi:hypothetical protein
LASTPASNALIPDFMIYCVTQQGTTPSAMRARMAVVQIVGSGCAGQLNREAYACGRLFLYT